MLGSMSGCVAIMCLFKLLVKRGLLSLMNVARFMPVKRWWFQLTFLITLWSKLLNHTFIFREQSFFCTLLTHYDCFFQDDWNVFQYSLKMWFQTLYWWLQGSALVTINDAFCIYFYFLQLWLVTVNSEALHYHFLHDLDIQCICLWLYQNEVFMHWNSS